MSGTANGHLDHLTDAELGSVTVTPSDDIVVGSYGTYTITYTVGTYGLDVGGGLKIGTRRMSDWGTPQFDDPQAPNYVTVNCSTDSTLSVRYNTRGHIRPFRAVIIVDLLKQTLYPGDQVSIVLGDRSGGSKGMLSQSFPESICEFAVFVDALSSGVYIRVPQTPPLVSVISGPAETFSIQVPSNAVVNEPFSVKINGCDRYGNPTACEGGNLVICADEEIPANLNVDHGRVRWIDDITIGRAGVHVLELHRENQLLARSNPIRVSDQQPGINLYWGDTQAQTASTVGAGTVEEYFTYARDIAGINFCTHQGNDFMVSDAAWDENVGGTKQFHEPGRFVTFLGYEWSGTAGAGGDRNVLFRGDKGVVYRSSSWQLPVADAASEKPTASAVHQALTEFAAKHNEKAILIPHVGGRRADIDSVNPELEPVIEICSCHGIFEWYLQEALAKNIKVGVLGASDDHTCRPGLAFPSTPEMAVQGGLGAVYAKDLTRESIFEALAARRCYATTGERMIVWAEADGHPMGSELTSDQPPQIKVAVYGTSPLEEVTLFNRNKAIYTCRPNPLTRNQNCLRFIWTGARGRDRNRYTVWDGKLTLSKGQILSAKTLNMYAPKEGIDQQTENEISWHSITAGHQVGILLELDAPDDAQIIFETSPATFDFDLKKVRQEDIFVDAGELDQSVTVSTLHSDGKVSHVEFDFIEEDLKPGSQAYYVRVVQENFHMAWTSPIYVNLKD